MPVQFNHPESSVVRTTGGDTTNTAANFSSSQGLSSLELKQNISIDPATEFSSLYVSTGDALDGFTFNNDGTMIFFTECDPTNNTYTTTKTFRIHYATLSTAYDVTTRGTFSYHDISYTYSGTYYNLNNPYRVFFTFADSGNKMLVAVNQIRMATSSGTMYNTIGYHALVFMSFDLSTAYDVTTASMSSQLGPLVTTTSTSQSYLLAPRFIMNDTGTKVYLFRYLGVNPYEYTLSTAYDFSTATVSSYNFFPRAYIRYAFWAYANFASYWFEDSGNTFYYLNGIGFPGCLWGQGQFYFAKADLSANPYSFSPYDLDTLTSTNVVKEIIAPAFNNSRADNAATSIYFDKINYIDSKSFDVPRNRAELATDAAGNTNNYTSYHIYNDFLGPMWPMGATLSAANNQLVRFNYRREAQVTYNDNIGQDLSFDIYTLKTGRVKNTGIDKIDDYSKSIEINAPTISIGAMPRVEDGGDSYQSAAYASSVIFIGAPPNYTNTTRNAYRKVAINIGYSYNENGEVDVRIGGSPSSSSVYVQGQALLAYNGSSYPTLLVNSTTLNIYGGVNIVPSTSSSPYGTSGNGARIIATGSASTVDLQLEGKGASGYVRFGTYSSGSYTPAGYIYIRDLAGNLRRLLVG